MDLDADGFGTTSYNACTLPTGYAVDSGDCDDNSTHIYPGANEICDGLDNNCDGLYDEDDAMYDSSSDLIYYFDEDGDGFGMDSTAQYSCASPGAEYVLLGQDCDDQNSSIAPDSIEECNGVDDNCNGDIDETFVDVNGYYSFDDHCGSCNTLCDDEITTELVSVCWIQTKHHIVKSSAAILDTPYSQMDRAADWKCKPIKLKVVQDIAGGVPHPHIAPPIVRFLVGAGRMGIPTAHASLDTTAPMLWTETQAFPFRVDVLLIFESPLQYTHQRISCGLNVAKSSLVYLNISLKSIDDHIHTHQTSIQISSCICDPSRLEL